MHIRNDVTITEPTNGHNGTNGHHGKKNGGTHTLRTRAAAVVHTVIRIVTKGFTALTISMDHLQQLLAGVIEHEAAFAEMAPIPPEMDPGQKGNVSLREGEVMGMILDAAKAHPQAFGVTTRNGKFVPWETAGLRADLERFLLLRRAAQASYIEKCNVAARVLGAKLREAILTKYENARPMTANNEPLRDALDEVMKHFGTPVQAKLEMDREAARAQARQAKIDAKAAREQARLEKATARKAALEAKQQAEAQKRKADAQLASIRRSRGSGR